MEINPSLFWFLLGVAFLVLEAVTPGFFLMFFGLGAWVVSLAVLFPPVAAGSHLQWLIFIVVSVLSLLIFRRKVKSLFQGRLAKNDNMDDPVAQAQYLNREVLVIKAVGPDQPGLVELNGTNWQARTDGPLLSPGQRARVIRLEGLTLILSLDQPEGSR